MKGGAIISKDRIYRYYLSRRWSNYTDSRVTFIMLNPSTATGTKNDPTIRRCINFAKRLKASRLGVVNLYALRATDPRDLTEWDDPVGPENDRYIERVARHSDYTILAWGNSIRFAPHPQERIERVLEILDYPYGSKLWCFGRTKNGQPRHPLMLPNKIKLERY